MIETTIISGTAIFNPKYVVCVFSYACANRYDDPKVKTIIMLRDNVTVSSYESIDVIKQKLLENSLQSLKSTV